MTVILDPDPAAGGSIAGLVEIDVVVQRIASSGAAVYVVDGADVYVQRADGSAVPVWQNQAGTVAAPLPLKSQNGRVTGWVQAGLLLRYRAVHSSLDPAVVWEYFVSGGGPVGATGAKGDVGATGATGPAGEPAPVAAWTAPTMLNAWVNWGADQETVGYYLDRGRVFLKGLIKNGTMETAAFTLPLGSRPPLTQILAVLTNPNVLGRVDVMASGNVLITAPSSNVFVSLAGLSFRVA